MSSRDCRRDRAILSSSDSLGNVIYGLMNAALPPRSASEIKIKIRALVDARCGPSGRRERICGLDSSSHFPDRLHLARIVNARDYSFAAHSTRTFRALDICSEFSDFPRYWIFALSRLSLHSRNARESLVGSSEREICRELARIIAAINK